MADQFYVYIMANRPRGSIYIGMTNNLVRRVHEHRGGATKGFSKTYKTNQLVYFEVFDDPISAIAREKRLKNWNRDWKIELIEKSNPTWLDLWDDITKS